MLDTIFAKTAWGRVQAREEFGIELPKGTCPSIEVAELLHKKVIEDVGFLNAQKLINHVIEATTGIQSTFGYDGYIFVLRAAWELYGVPTEHNGGAGEFSFCKKFVNLMKRECKVGNVIGKRQVRYACYKHSMELLNDV